MTMVTQDTPVAREVNRMRNRLRRMFEDPFALELSAPLFDARRMEGMAWSPAIEASETPKEYVITAELPGIAPENVEVAMSEGVLTIKGSKEGEKTTEDKDRTYYLWEREYGSFERTFRFPASVSADKVSADFSNGVLTVKVPKTEVVPPAVRTIPISSKSKK